MKTRWIASAFLCGMSISAFGQDRGTQAEQEACTPDVMRLCNDFVPDEAQIVACLKAKKSQLTPACSQVLRKK